MLFMVIERVRGADPVPVYRRFREHGRMMPPGVEYVGSWVEAGFGRVFQLMETDDLAALQAWMLAWREDVEFEVVPVISSAEMAAAVEPHL